MAKKKKTTKQKVTKLLKDKRFKRRLPWVAVALGILVGLGLAWSWPPNHHPKNLVWAVDAEVSIPSDLYRFLGQRRDCQDYKGTNTTDGVTLFAVYNVEQDRFAKMAYGCSSHLDFYIVAMKQQNKWTLLQPTEYFANNLPKCSVIEKYQIPRSFESFCQDKTGQLRENK